MSATTDTPETATAPETASPRPSARLPLLRPWWLEAKYEFLKLLRTPVFAIPTLLFAPVFYLMFGVALNRGNAAAAQYLLATYGVFATMSAALFGFGVTVAAERGEGLLALKRVQPLPPGGYLLAKLAMALLFSLLVAGLVAVIAGTLGGVSLPASRWVMLLAVQVLGAVPACALGLWIGTVTRGNAAPAVVNLIVLPMAFLAGLWLPLSMLPGVFSAIAPMLPAWHHAQLALKVVGMDSGTPAWQHAVALAAIGAGCFVLAARRLSRAG